MEHHIGELMKSKFNRKMQCDSKVYRREEHWNVTAQGWGLAR